MYAIEINKEKIADLNKSDEPKIYMWHWILHLFWMESATICAVCLSDWTEWILDSIRFKWLSKSKIRNGIEKLLCCWILIIKDWKLEFDKDRFLEMNSLWCKVDNEKYKNYIWMWTYEQVMEYEKMLKFVRKLVK